MPTALVADSPFTQILQNVVYALPGVLVFLHSTAAVETSIDGTLFTALVGSNTTGVTCADAFVRCTTGNCNIILKKY